jgi:hypothetical protein
MNHVQFGAMLTGYAYETVPNKRIFTWPLLRTIRGGI